jgi:two-component system, chemotaxis family, sensor kinase CheA
VSQDIYKYFRVEARELLENLGKGVLELEAGQPRAGLVPELLRLAHTLKGAARVVKQTEIAELAHAAEDILAPLREQPASLTSVQASEMLRLIDAMAARVNALAPPPQPNAKAVSEETLQLSRVDIGEMESLEGRVSELGVQVAALRPALESLERVRRVTDATELRSAVAGLERTLTSAVEQVQREMGQVREATDRLRLVPANAAFGQLERVARDTALAAERRIRFETRGGSVRLEAHVFGLVLPALVQLVRNAVAHGIEPENERAAAGKPREGGVALEVSRRGSHVSFVCRDDGRGVDLEAVRRLAQKKGLVSGDAAGQGAEKLFGMLLRGGLSTSHSVTEIAGRGVGLDIVRDAAARLGGDVAVCSEPNIGTTVELVVPVSSCIVEALIVEASGARAAIPLDSVQGVVQLDLAGRAGGTDHSMIIFRDRATPVVALARILHTDIPGARSGIRCAPVVWAGDGLAAVGVDRLVGLANVLVRPLPALVPPNPVVAGAFLDAEGNPQLVLDPEGLVAAAGMAGHMAAPAESVLPAPILVVDDSLTTRMLEQSILESAGYEVDIAVSGEDALEKARQRRYGLFLVDVEMPGMDGFTFIERTRADAAIEDVPTILVTSRGSMEDRARGQAAGAAAHIVKSEFDQGELLASIQRLMEAS